MTYSLHCGNVREDAPTRVGSLYEHDVEGWYDFYAQAVSQDNEGNVDHKTVGCIHPAARSSGKDTAFRPSVKNMAPRKQNWKPSESNTQQPPRK